MPKTQDQIYQEVTDRIVGLLESGTVPWSKPWNPSKEIPVNGITKKPYKGVNIWMLLYSQFNCRYWATFNQIKGMKGKIKKGSTGRMVVYWNFVKRMEENRNGVLEEKAVPFLKTYTVFNLEQTEGIEIPDNSSDEVLLDFKPIEGAEEIILNMSNCPHIYEGGHEAYYLPEQDAIRMPMPESFKSEEDYYATLFHELSHSTGHKSRLNRPTLVNLNRFGSSEYSKEELVAEFSSSFLCGVANINKENIIENSAAYINGWSKKLKENPRWLVSACGQATKSANYILGIKENNN